MLPSELLGYPQQGKQFPFPKFICFPSSVLFLAIKDRIYLCTRCYFTNVSLLNFWYHHTRLSYGIVLVHRLVTTGIPMVHKGNGALGLCHGNTWMRIWWSPHMTLISSAWCCGKQLPTFLLISERDFISNLVTSTCSWSIASWSGVLDVWKFNQTMINSHVLHQMSGGHSQNKNTSYWETIYSHSNTTPEIRTPLQSGYILQSQRCMSCL